MFTIAASLKRVVIRFPNIAFVLYFIYLFTLHILDISATRVLVYANSLPTIDLVQPYS